MKIIGKIIYLHSPSAEASLLDTPSGLKWKVE